VCEDGSVSVQKVNGLTADDLVALAAGVEAGKRVTVYLREPMVSLGLEAGASARVVGVDGSTVTVRPKGVDDELPFEANELNRTRSQAPTRAPAKPSTPRQSRGESTPVATPASSPAPAPEVVSSPSPKPVPAKASSRRSKESTAAVSVTVTSAGASTWTVSVSRGAKKQGKPVEVTADRVARAVRELGDDAAIAAVDGVIASAREAAQKRVAELSQELENARAALADLDGD